MGSTNDRHLTSKALNALWGVENSARSRHEQRPHLWQPSMELLLSCKYEQLVRIPSVGPKTAELIMKWKRKFTKEGETNDTENAHQGLSSTGTD